MIVKAWPSSVIGVPITSLGRRIRAARTVAQDRHRPSGPPPRRSSSAVKIRPRCAGTPSVSKNRPLTNRPCAFRVSPPEFRLKRGLPTRRRPRGLPGDRGCTPTAGWSASCCDTADPLEADDHQPIRLVDRQRLQDQRVHQREDGDVGADAQRQRQSATPLTMGVCRICRRANFRSRPSEDTNPMAPFDGRFPDGWPVSYVFRKGKQAPIITSA